MKKKVHCEICGKEIPSKRLEILPDTTTCVKCSQTQPYSETEIITTGADEQERNRLNIEDFEGGDSEPFRFYPNDEWQDES